MNPRVSPEFILRPSLSDRRRPPHSHRPLAGVAGVYTPAFVERVAKYSMVFQDQAGVAGVYTPAFVERAAWPRYGPAAAQVSPEFILRPSLSVVGLGGTVGCRRRVSPEFILRPSLSDSLDQVARGL